MLQLPATRRAPPVDDIYQVIAENLGANDGDVATERLLDLFRHLSDRYDTDVSSPLNMGYFCIDADAASLAAMDETNRRAANIAVEGQHPAAVAFEKYSLDLLLRSFGFDGTNAHGHYTACGTEANLTAMIVALTEKLSHRNPNCTAYDASRCTNELGEREPYEYYRHGGLPLTVRPTIYLTEQAHKSFAKNARNLIGATSIRDVPMDPDLRMDPAALDQRLTDDRTTGNVLPFFVVGTAGATPSGIIDPLGEIGAVCRKHGAWFHVDAPWGGIAAFCDRLRGPFLEGLAAADSMIFDPHKTLVPLGAGGTGMFMTRHADAVERAFNVSGEAVESHDFGYMSLQGSRANSGLRVLTQILRPRELRARVEREMALGDRVRDLLRAAGWQIVNSTPFPIVCAVHPRMADGAFSAEEMVAHLREHGVLAWPEHLRADQPDAVRLGIISRRTDADSLHYVVDRMRTFADGKG